VSVASDTAEKKTYTAGSFDRFFISGAFGFFVLCRPVQYVNIFFIDIDVIKKIVEHKIMIALRMFVVETDVFVHIERDDVFKRNLSRFI